MSFEDQISQKLGVTFDAVMMAVYGLLAVMDEVSWIVATAIGVTVVMVNIIRFKNYLLDRKMKKMELREKEIELKAEELRLREKEIDIKEERA